MFWLYAILLMIGAAAFLIVPFLRTPKKDDIDREQLNVAIYKDKLAEMKQDLSMGVISQEQFENAEKDLRLSLAEDVAEEKKEGEEQKLQLGEAEASKFLLVGILLIVPVVSLLLYNQLGTSMQDIVANRASPDGGGSPHQGMDIEKMVAQLTAELEKEPMNPEGWVMLGRAYTISANKNQKAEYFQKAAEAYDRANSLLNSSDPNVLADYADALAMTTRSLNGRPLELIQKALAIQPFHQKSLWLAATQAYQVQNYKLAIEYFEKLKSQLKPDSKDAEMIASNIQQMRNLMEGKVPAPPSQAQMPAQQQAQAQPQPAPTAPPQPTVAAGNVSITGEVSIASVLKQGASPSDTVFIYAKAASGPPMPLAILKKQVKDLPMKFELNDSMAMNPSMKLSKFSKVVVLARVSKTGNAMTQSGDFQGSSQVIDVGSKGIKVQINTVIP